MAGKKILVVDDDMAMHEFYRAFFAGHDVTLVTSGEEGLSIFQAAPTAFDLIYLDLELLGMSGFSTLEAIRATPVAQFPPIVVSSSLSDADTQKQALEMGAAAFVPKPINMAFAKQVADRLLK